MTLLDTRNQIVGRICEKGLFTTDDFLSIKVPAEFAAQRDDLTRAALEQLCNIGMLAKVGDNMWILSDPLNGGGQEVGLSMGVCNEIANVINTFAAAENAEAQVDALNIHEGHIVALLQIIDQILGNETEQ